MAEIRKVSVLEQHRFTHTGKPAIFGVQTDWWRDSDLCNMTLLGSAKVSRSEAEIVHKHMTFAVGTTHASIHAADYSAEGEWRWANDRDAFVAEQELVKAKAAQKQAAADQRYRDRLSKLTWEQLLSETPFPDWEIPPPDFTLLARDLIHDASTALKALGPKPRKAWVRRILKETVERFNEADDAAGGVIETEEREDICEVLEELAFVAGQRSLTEEIDDWRNW